MSKDPEQRKFGIAMTVGTALTSYIVGGLIAGYFLDRWLGTAPWLLLVGVTLGTTGAFIWLYHTLAKLN
ncbi:MAG: AtpZ/AtpI family protein [Blastocatellia bacterium]